MLGGCEDRAALQTPMSGAYGSCSMGAPLLKMGKVNEEMCTRFWKL